MVKHLSSITNMLCNFTTTYRKKTSYKSCLITLGIFVSLLTSFNIHALTASIDRDRIPLNESVQLQIQSSRAKSLDSIDLSPIEKHFDIVNRSTQSEFSMVNGRTESLQKLVLTLTPRKIGSFTIPSLVHKKERSRPLAINVVKAVTPPDKMGDQSILLSAKIDKNNILVGEQLIYTLTIMYRINLASADLSELSQTDADITALEDKSYRRQINGQNYQVAEKRYAIHFKTPGKITINGQALTAIINNGSRSRFGFGSLNSGQKIKLAAENINVTVEDIPTEANKTPWLPAESLTLSEDWEQQGSVIAGEPISRSISIVAKGLTAEQLPEPASAPLDSINQYPEKPEFLNQEWQGGLAGKRTDTIVLIPTQAGSFTLPAITIDWWNTKTHRKQTSTLPARTINVVLGKNNKTTTVQNDASRSDQSSNQSTDLSSTDTEVLFPQPSNDNVATSAQLPSSKVFFWKTTAITIGIGWFLSVILLSLKLKQNRQTKNTQQEPLSTATDLKKKKQEVIDACNKNDSTIAKQALHSWLIAIAKNQSHEDNTAFSHSSQPTQILETINDANLNHAVEALNNVLFHPDSTATWNGSALKTAIESVEINKPASSSNRLLPLYPTT